MTLIPRHYRAALLPALVLSALLAGCSSTDSQDRHEKDEPAEDRKVRRASHAESFRDRRRARTEAEDQRYDDWFNRIMGRPGSS
jgi:outer membrane biogenesis lipoprotein LolB